MTTKDDITTMTNMHASVTEFSDAISLGCTVGDNHYHVWVTRGSPTVVNPVGIAGKKILYCRARSTTRHEARVSKRDATKAANQHIVRPLLDAAPRLIAEADARLADTVRAMESKLVAARDTERARDLAVVHELIARHAAALDRERQDALAEAIADALAAARIS